MFLQTSIQKVSILRFRETFLLIAVIISSHCMSRGHFLKSRKYLYIGIYYYCVCSFRYWRCVSVCEGWIFIMPSALTSEKNKHWIFSLCRYLYIFMRRLYKVGGVFWALISLMCILPWKSS